MTAYERKSSRDRAGASEIPLAEKVTAGLGLVLAIGTIGLILYEGIRGRDLPPDMAVHVEQFLKTGNGHLAEIRVTNEGDRTAAQVTVTGELKRNTEVVETSQMTFDFIPGNSERRGGLFFRQDPHSLVLDLRATGYTEP